MIHPKSVHIGSVMMVSTGTSSIVWMSCRMILQIIQLLLLVVVIITITNQIEHVTSLLLLLSTSGSSFPTGVKRPLLVEKYKSRSLLDRSGGILYRTSVVASKKEWDVIYQEVMRTLPFLQPESKSSIAQHRYGIALSSITSPTVQLLKDPNGSITKYINRIASPSTQCEYVLAPDIPVEIRSYEKRNANMNWHIDDVLYHPIPQVEIILTILNTSNCQTMWQLGGNENDNTDNKKEASIHSIETEPNSLLCLRAGVTSHCVTPLQYGKRIILKCAYIPRSVCDEKDDSSQNNNHTVTTLMAKDYTQNLIVNTKQFQSIPNKKPLRRKKK